MLTLLLWYIHGCVVIHTRTHAHMHVCAHTCTHTGTYMHTYRHIYTHTCIIIYTHTHTRACTYTHTHTLLSDKFFCLSVCVCMCLFYSSSFMKFCVWLSVSVTIPAVCVMSDISFTTVSVSELPKLPFPVDQLPSTQLQQWLQLLLNLPIFIHYQHLLFGCCL